MKLTAELDGAQHALTLERTGAHVVAQVDDRRYELDAQEVEPGVYLLQTGGRVYECRMRAKSGTHGTHEVHVGQQTFQLTLIDPKRLRHVEGAGILAAGRAAVVAAMPGKVVRVLVEQGVQVKADEALLIVEAMKMQNELKSPKAGTIIELHAVAGATVNAGDVLAVIE
ncbi:MAG: acetyl-CoA carboxylase biotin carboxyl carrier protein subunit [Pyrinomonadaceae bacterium]